MKKILLTCCMVGFLSGCAALSNVETSQNNPLGKFVKSDNANALALAKASNDTVGATCFTAIDAALTELNTVPFTMGLLYTAEFTRVMTKQKALIAQACVGITVPL